jgi:hypothetical protein
MRSRFRFPFSCSSFQLAADAEISFLVSGSIPSADHASEMLERAKIDFRLSPERPSANAAIDGLLFITVPGPPEEVELLARLLASDLAEHLCFFYPGFRILGGLLSGERIAETPEEEAAIGEGRFWAKVSIEEIEQPAAFDPELLRYFPYARDLLTPVAQLNEASRATSPIDAYLSAIKVFEFLYHGLGRTFAQSLQQSDELRSAVATCIVRRTGEEAHPPSEAEIVQFLADLADTRNQCAHLRDSGNYGYGPRHPEIFSVVQPRLECVRTLAKHILRARMVSARDASQAGRRPDTSASNSTSPT